MNVAERVRKLLALANDKNSPAEAEAAALAAQRLMVKYGIEPTTEESKVIHEFSTISSGRYWRFRLAAIIAPAFRCRSAIAGTRPVFFGSAMDVEVVIEVHKHLFSVGDRYARAAVREYKREHPHRRTIGAYNMFIDGFLSGINSRLSEQSKALMVIVPDEVNEYVDSRTRTVKTSIGRRSSMSPLALNDGSARRLYSQGHDRGRQAICHRLD
ncbi:MAG: DUF2786 domain-containing protein [Sphaerochaeta sp.]|nr:DUF2786 domain-containing protein [Sphaerochaeta sp.]